MHNTYLQNYEVDMLGRYASYVYESAAHTDKSIHFYLNPGRSQLKQFEGRQLYGRGV